MILAIPYRPQQPQLASHRERQTHPRKSEARSQTLAAHSSHAGSGERPDSIPEPQRRHSFYASGSAKCNIRTIVLIIYVTKQMTEPTDSSRQAGAEIAEIEVTPQMIEAGIAVLEAWASKYHYDTPDPIPAAEDLVRAIATAWGNQAGLALDQVQGRWTELLQRNDERHRESVDLEGGASLPNRVAALERAVRSHLVG